MPLNHRSYSLHVIKGLPREVWNRLHQQGFYVTFLWALDHFVRMCTGAPARQLSQITSNIYLGGQYSRRGWRILQKQRITSVVNLRIEFDDELTGITPDQYLFLPTIEDKASTQEQLANGVQFMTEVIDRNESVYVHCRSGVGRSAALVAAYLINTGQTVNQAWDHIFKTRPFIRPTRAQKDSIDQYADKLKAGLC